jgi:cell wall assembly regulator SMI1
VRAGDGRVSMHLGLLGIEQQLPGQLRVRQLRVREPVPGEPRVQHEHGKLRLPHDVRDHLLPERDALLSRKHVLYGLRRSERGVQRVLTGDSRHAAKTVVALRAVMSETVWAPIERALSGSSRATDASLGEAASDEDLSKLRALLAPFELPESFVAAWKQHDGEALGRDETVVRGRLLLPLRAIASEYATMREVAERESYDVEADAGVRRERFAKGWLPIVLLGGASDFHCIDLDPADGGAAGQIIEVSHEITPRRLIAKDLASYFASMAARLAGDPDEGDDERDERGERDERAQAAPPKASVNAARALQKTEAPARKSAPFTVALAVGFWLSLGYAFARNSKIAGFVAFVLWLVYLLVRFVQRRATSER